MLDQFRTYISAVVLPLLADMESGKELSTESKILLTSTIAKLTIAEGETGYDIEKPGITLAPSARPSLQKMLGSMWSTGRKAYTSLTTSKQPQGMSCWSALGHARSIC